MAPRGSRSRKTADRMAVYKTAADRKRQVSARAASRTSPRKKAQEKSAGQIGSAQNNGNEQVVVQNDGETKTREICIVQKQPSSVESSVSDEIDMLDPNTVVPETPEHAPRVQSRKRVHAPVQLNLPESRSNDRSDTVKPSKKRKEFHTPPRESVIEDEGTPLEIAGNGNQMLESNRRARGALRKGGLLKADEVSDSESLEMTVDELTKVPVPSSQKISFLSSRQVSNAPSRSGRNNSTYHSFKPVGENPHAIGRMDVGGFAHNVENLEMMAVSSATIKRMFEKFAAQVMSEMRMAREAQVSEIRRIGTTISDAVACEIRGLHGLVEMFSGGVKTTGAVRTSGKTSLSEWEKKLDALTPYVNDIFGKKLISQIICFNVPLKCVGIYQKYESSDMSDVERASQSAQTLMFSLQPRDKKFQYSGDVDQLHSDFKFSGVQNCFFNVQRDTFSLFKSKGQTPADDDVSRRGLITAPVLSRPFWLGEGKVLMEHINQARGFIETVGQTRKDKIRRCRTPDDIACHGALRVYRQLGSRLHDGRGSLRIAFFLGVGYLLVPWTDRILDFDHSSVELSMEDEDDLSLRIDSIPCTAQCSTCGINTLLDP